MLCRVHGWAGHMARYSQYDVTKWAGTKLRWRNISYINNKRLNSIDMKRLNRGHPRFLWRWEQPIHEHYQAGRYGLETTWYKLAKHKQSWAESAYQWAVSRAHSFPSASPA